jgi:small-conductance mechanosensitive channel
MSYPQRASTVHRGELKEHIMYNIVWLVGAVVIVLFVLGYFGLR